MFSRIDQILSNRSQKALKDLGESTRGLENIFVSYELQYLCEPMETPLEMIAAYNLWTANEITYMFLSSCDE